MTKGEAIAAVERHWREYESLPEKLKKDETVALAAAAAYAPVYKLFPETLKRNREFVQNAIRKNASIFHWIAEDQKAEETFQNAYLSSLAHGAPFQEFQDGYHRDHPDTDVSEFRLLFVSEDNVLVLYEDHAIACLYTSGAFLTEEELPVWYDTELFQSDYTGQGIPVSLLDSGTDETIQIITEREDI
jgi:hypothetical protein